MWRRLWTERLALTSAGVTFYVIFGIFPALAALVSLYGLVTDGVELQRHIQLLSGYLPAAALELLSHELDRITETRPATLGRAFVLGVAFALWSVNNAILSLFEAMNLAYNEIERRSFIRLYVTSLLLTIATLASSIIMINAVFIMPYLLSGMGFHQDTDAGFRLISAPFLLVLVIIGSSVIFRVGPSRRNAKWRWITPGSIFVGVIWLAAWTSVSWYLSDIADYSAMYGSLGAAIGLMLWVYVSVYVLIVGAQLNAEVERQTLTDTTVGPDRRRGSRDAFVADSVGGRRWNA